MKKTLKTKKERLNTCIFKIKIEAVPESYLKKHCIW